jgi:hypothetical protein
VDAGVTRSHERRRGEAALELVLRQHGKEDLPSAVHCAGSRTPTVDASGIAFDESAFAI